MWDWKLNPKSRPAAFAVVSGAILLGVAMGFVRTHSKGTVPPVAQESRNTGDEVQKTAHERVEQLLSGASHREKRQVRSDKKLAQLATVLPAKEPRTISEKLEQASTKVMKRLVDIRNCERLTSFLGNKERERQFNQKALSGCPVNSSESRFYAEGYAQSLVDASVQELAFLQELAKAALERGYEIPFDLAKISGTYIKHTDDNVREAALDLATVLMETETPANQRAASRIAMEALKLTVSGRLAEQALDLLANAPQDIKPQVERSVLSVYKNSGWDVRAAIASQSYAFMSSHTYHAFTKIMDSEPPRSKIRLELHANLKEFERQASL